MSVVWLVFGALTQNRSSLEPSLGFAAIAETPLIENGGTFARFRHHGASLSTAQRHAMSAIELCRTAAPG
jgi:hypothetical protein